MFKKFAALAAAAALSLGVMTGCGASGTTADSTGYSAENPLVLTLAHGLSETHTVHIAIPSSPADCTNRSKAIRFFSLASPSSPEP